MGAYGAWNYFRASRPPASAAFNCHSREHTMSTAEQTAQPTFPETEWEQLAALMAEKGPEGVVSYIGTFPPEERLKLYGFAQRAFSGREWSHASLGKNLDDYAVVAKAALAETLRQGDESDDPEVAAKRRQLGIGFSFNLTADLAECWPGDTLPRERRHFEEGLRAAQTCVDLCESLGVNASRTSIAFWGKGMHQLSLGDLPESLETFARSLRLAEEFAASEGAPTTLSPEASFHILLGHGYLGIAEWLGGNQEGRARYDRAIEAFTAQAATFAEKREDAEFGIAQLQHVRTIFIS